MNLVWEDGQPKPRYVVLTDRRWPKYLTILLDRINPESTGTKEIEQLVDNYNQTVEPGLTVDGVYMLYSLFEWAGIVHGK